MRTPFFCTVFVYDCNWGAVAEAIAEPIGEQLGMATRD